MNPPNIDAFRTWVRKRHPKIRAYEENDLDWRDEGMVLLQEGRFGLAENKFQKLMLSQPEHFDGYEGLAHVYEKTGRMEEARMLMDYALSLAQRCVNDAEMDQEPFDAMKAFRARLS